MSETASRPRYLTCAETAKLVRAALKAAFPGVKFSVRSHTYSGGASLRIYWTDGPFEPDVQRVTDLYRGATFDGMIDLKEYRDSVLVGENGTIEHVHFGADYIFGDRSLSEEYQAKLAVEASRVLREPFDLGGSYWDGFACEHGVFTGGNGHNVIRWLSQHVPA